MLVGRGHAMRLPHLEVSGGLLGGRTLFAVHTAAPVHRRLTAAWNRDLDVIGRWTRGPVAPLVVGDLNATLDHSVLRDGTAGCGDAAAQTGSGLIGTWPNWAPRWLGPQIDHVFSTGGIVADSFSVRDVPGTDHRAIVTTLRLPR